MAVAKIGRFGGYLLCWMSMLHRFIREKPSQAAVVAGAALALTTLFHSLLVHWPYGRGFAVFVFAAVFLSLIVLALKPGPRNGWAYVFFIPVIMAGVSQLLYANRTNVDLSWLVAIVAFVAAMYWGSVPRISYAEVRSFWPAELLRSVLWPLASLRSYVRVLATENRSVMVGLGVVIALPFLGIFVILFSSADPLFKRVVSDFFSFSSGGFSISRLVRDTLIFLYFLGTGWTMLLRTALPAVRSWAIGLVSSIIPQTVLSCLNALFLLFLGFQIPYLMGGGSFIAQYGITYADYARNGFFQLLIAGAIALALVLAVHVATEFRERVTRLLGALLIVQTLVILVSAVSRLHLYIGAYGLTVDRSWAAYGIFCIAVVLIMTLVTLVAQMESFRLRKTLSVVALGMLTVPLLVNVERIVVNYNIWRVEAHPNQELDVVYLHSLSSDAIPLQVALLQRAQLPEHSTLLSSSDLVYLRQYLLNRRDRTPVPWWGRTLSDDVAAESLKGVR